jgi:hypothetical protein
VPIEPGDLARCWRRAGGAKAEHRNHVRFSALRTPFASRRSSSPAFCVLRLLRADPALRHFWLSILLQKRTDIGIHLADALWQAGCGGIASWMVPRLTADWTRRFKNARKLEFTNEMQLING